MQKGTGAPGRQVNVQGRPVRAERPLQIHSQGQGLCSAQGVLFSSLCVAHCVNLSMGTMSVFIIVAHGE